MDCYLVNFDIKLKDDRKNGSYPVTLYVDAEDINGNFIHKEFSVNVVIADENRRPLNRQQRNLLRTFLLLRSLQQKSRTQRNRPQMRRTKI